MWAGSSIEAAGGSPATTDLKPATNLLLSARPQLLALTGPVACTAPVINDQILMVDENSVAGTVVGNLASSDPDVGDTLNYSTICGDLGGVFSVNAATGQVLVINPAVLDFETNPSISMIIRVTDSGIPTFSDTANVTIQLNDLGEVVVSPRPAPVSAAEGDDKQPVVEPKADKPVAKPTSTTLRSVGATRMESTSASRSQLNALSAAADQANEPPITEVEIAVEALAALRGLSRRLVVPDASVLAASA